MKKDDIIKNRIASGLDQDYAAVIDFYDSMTPRDRGKVSTAIVEGQHGIDIPQSFHQIIAMFASIGFLEVASRWAENKGK